MTESIWLHCLCRECWDKEHPEKEPSRVKEDYSEEEICCQCRQIAKSGIYIRRHGSELPCKGIHYKVLGTGS